MSFHDAGVDVVRALARVRTLLDSAASGRERPGLRVSRSVSASEFKDGVLTIDVFLTVIGDNGVETEWFAEARNAPIGWVISRHVAVQALDGGEVKNLGRTDLADVDLADSASLAEALPALVEELLARPAPDFR